ncbi:MAG: methyltransferase domain-containing protein [Candidatus Eremiobacteraeota bacterium]|nr:methyltransferase domain-containing protein [Candidatus Eremiobacteraeota bacterium]
MSLLERAGLKPGMKCLDVGCGGGDVTFEIARLVESGGSVVAMDFDEVKIDLARAEANAQHLANIDFRVADLEQCVLGSDFDFAYCKYIFSHLQNPERVLSKIRETLRPGGIVVAVDTNWSGYFAVPDSSVLQRFVELYIQTLKRRGGDANMGLRLPSLLSTHGFEGVQMSVLQLAATSGEVKLLTPITMENIADSVIAENLASKAEVDSLVADLYKLANDPHKVLSTCRVIEAWGRRRSA